MVKRGLFLFICIISFSLLMTIVFSIKRYKKLQQHPASLIAAICLVEALMTQSSYVQMNQITAPFTICYFGSYKLFSYSVFFDAEEGNSMKSYVVMCQSQEIIQQYFQIVSIFLNMCFCHDLIKTLENPFEVARTRTIRYFIFSFTWPALITFLIWIVTR